MIFHDLLQLGVLSLTALSCSLIGPFLVLKRMSMFVNSLSHTVLLGLALAFLLLKVSSMDFSVLLIAAFLSSLLTAFLTEVLIRFFHLQEDASIGLVFNALFALGIVLVSLYMRNMHLGVEAVMGNVDILQIKDLRISLFLALVNLSFVLLFYRPLQMLCFDASLAKIFRIRSGAISLLLPFLSSTTCMGAFRSVGVLVVLVFLVGPFLIARLFSSSLKPLLFLSPLIGVGVSVFAVILSRICFEVFGLALSTGGLVSLLMGLIYLFSKWILSDKLAPCKRKSPS